MERTSVSWHGSSTSSFLWVGLVGRFVCIRRSCLRLFPPFLPSFLLNTKHSNTTTIAHPDHKDDEGPRTTGPQDHRTTGPQDHRTTGPQDHRTKAPKHQGNQKDGNRSTNQQTPNTADWLGGCGGMDGEGGSGGIGREGERGGVGEEGE